MHTIEIRNDFKWERVKCHFYLKNVIYQAYKKLQELKHKGIVCEYKVGFITPIIQIPNLSNEDFMFYFIEELHEWAKRELQCCDIKLIDETKLWLSPYKSLLYPNEGKENPDSGRKEERVEEEKKDFYWPPKGGMDENDFYQQLKDGRDDLRKDFY